VNPLAVNSNEDPILSENNIDLKIDKPNGTNGSAKAPDVVVPKDSGHHDEDEHVIFPINFFFLSF
jgi:hypothetical protein